MNMHPKTLCLISFQLIIACLNLIYSSNFSSNSTVEELIYAWKIVRLKSRLGLNLLFFLGFVHLQIFSGSNLIISY